MSLRKNPVVGLHLAGAGAVAMMTGAVYIAGVRPLMAERLEAWKLDRSLEEKRSSVEELRSELSSTRQELAQTQQLLKSSSVTLVGSSLVNSQLAKLGIAAEEAGILLNETAPGPPEEGKSLVRIPIKISGKGHYPDFARFLAGVDRDLKDTVVVGFHVGGRGDAPQEPATFSVDLLWYALREGAGSEDPGGGKGTNPPAGG